MKKTGLGILAMLLLLGSPVQADDSVKKILIDMTHTERWNRFADKMLALHEQRISQFKIRTTEKLGGYYRMPDFYKEVRYIDSATDRLISLVQWETKKPDLVHYMELYFYDTQGRVERDYGLSFLTDGRNAPMATMINFHAYNGKLHAFRQFDASNNRLYEFCEGTYKGKPVEIKLIEMEILEFEDLPKSIMTSPEYKACFKGLPATAGKYLTPQ